LGKRAFHCKALSHYSAVIAAETAELIQMPFGLWTWVSPRKRVLDGDPGPRDKFEDPVFEL